MSHVACESTTLGPSTSGAAGTPSKIAAARVTTSESETIGAATCVVSRNALSIAALSTESARAGIFGSGDDAGADARDDAQPVTNSNTAIDGRKRVTGDRGGTVEVGDGRTVESSRNPRSPKPTQGARSVFVLTE